MGKPTQEQLSRINQLAKTPLTEEQVYTFPAKLVGDKVIPNRYQRITPNFLRKMTDQAKEGVSLLLDHSWANLGIMTIPLGRTFDSRLQQDGDELALYADHYMVKGQTINAISTDELATSIDAGTIFDTSIGFIGSKHTCSICGDDYYSGDCMHMRGRTYDDNKLCIVEIDDGDLMENSLVFDGAYPGAGIVGMSQSESNETEIEWVSLGDTKSLPGDGRIFYSFSNKSGLVGYVRKPETKGDDQVSELEQAKQQLSVLNGQLSKVREMLKVSTDAEVEGALSSLNKKAEIGESYAVKVVEEACGAGVRALGDAFNVAAMKGALSNLPVAEVEKIRETYEAQAKAVLGNGGQHVVTASQELPDDPTKNPQAKTTESREELAKDAISALKRHGHADIVKEDK